MKAKTETAAILNPDGNIEIIEFFDYNCGHCRNELKVINELIKKRSDVRVVLKAIPILGQSSLYATQIGHAILISEPKKYLKYFESIMNNYSSEDSIMKALKDSGADIEKLKKVLEMQNNEIADIIKADINLADKNGVTGTPSFIINGKLVPGAMDLNSILSYLK